MVKVRMMTRRGDEPQEMSKEQLIDFVCKVNKGKYFMVDPESNKMIQDVNTIRDDQAITIMPVVKGGSQ